MDTDPALLRRGAREGHASTAGWSRRRSTRCTRSARRPAAPIRSTSCARIPTPTARRGIDGVFSASRRSRSPFKRLLNGGNEIEFFRCLAVGERCVAKARYADVRLKEGKSGAMLLVTIETDVHHRERRAAADQPADADLEVSPMALHYDDVAIGAAARRDRQGRRCRTAHIMRWSAAVENWHRIHYDQPFATEHDKLPDVLINGSWKQHVLVQLVKDSLGADGWLWKIQFRYKKMDVAGRHDPRARRRRREAEVDGLGFVTLRVVLTDQNDAGVDGRLAIGVLPLRGGPPVPYPFVPQARVDAVQLPADD